MSLEIITPLSNLVWREEWYHKWESPWSVFRKLQFANVASSTEILMLLGTEETRSKKHLQNNNGIGCLWSLNDFDDSLLDRLGLKEMYDQHILFKNIVEKQFAFDSENLWLKDVLQYCPICISMGYHSLIHQLTLVNQCLIHKCPLKTSCPNCHISHLFHLQDKNMDSSFVCNCGHNYLSSENFPMAWEVFNHKIIFDDTIVQSLLKSKREVNKQRHFTISNHRFSQYVNPLVRFLSSRSNHYNVKTKKICVLNAKKSGEIEEIEVSKIFFQHNKAIFKSIARHIKKRYLKNHRRCIRKMKHGFFRNDYCGYAYTYLYWRKDIEGYRDFSHVSKGPRRGREAKLPGMFYSAVHEPFLTDLTDWLIGHRIISEHDKVSKSKAEGVLLAVEQVYPLLIWNHFLSWSKAAKENIREQEDLHIFPCLPYSEFSKIPFFVYSLNKSKGEVTYKQHNSLRKMGGLKLNCFMNTPNEKANRLPHS